MSAVRLYPSTAPTKAISRVPDVGHRLRNNELAPHRDFQTHVTNIPGESFNPEFEKVSRARAVRSQIHLRINKIHPPFEDPPG